MVLSERKRDRRTESKGEKGNSDNFLVMLQMIQTHPLLSVALNIHIKTCIPTEREKVKEN